MMSNTSLTGILDTVPLPHHGQSIISAGVELDRASAAMILLHGRGSSATEIIRLAKALAVDDVSYLAPQATDHSWYPYPFMSPITDNEPALSSALAVIETLLVSVSTHSIPLEKIVIGGFSQGACLTCEFAYRNPRRYGGIVGLSGGLIGANGTPRSITGDLAGTPVFLGCSDVDQYIPISRVEETATTLQTIGGQVTKQIYSGMGHLINADEISQVRNLLRQITGNAPSVRQ